MESFRLFSQRSCRPTYGRHEPLVRSTFSSRNRFSDSTMVLKQNTLQEVRLLTRSLLLRLADLLHHSSVSPALVQWRRLQPARNDERSDRLFQPLLGTSQDR